MIYGVFVILLSQNDFKFLHFHLREILCYLPCQLHTSLNALFFGDKNALIVW